MGLKTGIATITQLINNKTGFLRNIITNDNLPKVTQSISQKFRTSVVFDDVVKTFD